MGRNVRGVYGGFNICSGTGFLNYYVQDVGLERGCVYVMVGSVVFHK